MKGDALYSDRLVEVAETEIAFHRYFFFYGTKRVPHADISSLKVCRYNGPCGIWRIHGSGDLKTWFPCDWRRPRRDTAYILTRHSSRWNIGFTVENPSKFEEALIKAGIQMQTHDSPHKYVGP